MWGLPIHDNEISDPENCDSTPSSPERFPSPIVDYGTVLVATASSSGSAASRRLGVSNAPGRAC